MKLTKTRFFAFVPVLLLSFTLAACGSSSGNTDTDGDNSASASTASSGGNTIAQSTTTSSASAPTKTVGNTGASKSEPASANKPVKYISGRDFSDGVAWAQAETKQWHLVDKTGKILLELNAGVEPRSDYYHGVALVRKDFSPNTMTGVAELIDKSGKVISSPESGEYDIICGLLHEFGYIIVMKTTVTLKATENFAGVIDRSGKWHIKLTNDPVLVEFAYNFTFQNSIGLEQPLHSNVGQSGGMARNVMSPSYIGEGVFIHSRNYAKESHFFDVLNGKSWIVKDDTGRMSQTLGGRHLLRIENGNGVFAPSSSESSNRLVDIYSVNVSTGVSNKIISNGVLSRIGNYKEGLFYAENNPAGSGSQKGFYDINGTLVINLSEYGVANSSDIPEFTDGYAFLNINNPQGAGFYTVINKKGDFMFEPRRREAGTVYFSSPREGFIIIHYGGNYQPQNRLGGADSSTIMNVSGEIIAEIKPETNAKIRISVFRDGVAKVVNFRGNQEVETYYIDTQGKRLF